MCLQNSEYCIRLRPTKLYLQLWYWQLNDFTLRVSVMLRMVDLSTLAAILLENVIFVTENGKAATWADT